MRHGLQVGLALAGGVCLLSFAVPAGWARLDGTSTETHKWSRIEIGRPWVWYYAASEYHEWPGGYEGWDEWRVLASPAWVLLPAAVGLFLLSRQLRPPAEGRAVTATTVTRRELAFNDLDEVVGDAGNLLARGYDKAGNWDLAQVCGHLAEWVRYPLDGFPRAPLLARPVFWLIRNTVGRRVGRAMLAGGRMRPGMPTAPQSVPAPGGDDAAGVGRLRESIARWKAHTGVLHASPLFGGLTREQWEKGHLIHCAHHLSFLVPRA